MSISLKSAASITALGFAAALALTACEEQGPAEQLGESIDESAAQVGEAVEDAGEGMQDTAN